MSAITLSEYSRMVGISEEILIGKARPKHLSTARQVHWLYMRSVDISYDKIAGMYCRRRTSIMSGVKTIRNMIETKDSLVIPYLGFVDSFSRQENDI